MGSGTSRPKGPGQMLYYCPMSAPCRALMLALKTANIPFQTAVVDLLKGEQFGEEFSRINPDRTVPTINDSGFKLWESRAVMTYLVDAYAPDHPTYPRDPKKRAVISRLLYTDNSMISRNITEFTAPQIREKMSADPVKAAEVEKALDYIENTLEENKFLAGANQVTLADFSVMSVLTMLQLVDWKFDTRWPKVEKWMRKMQSLPHYDEVNPIEDFRQKIREMHSHK